MGSFAVATVLGFQPRFYVVTTAMWLLLSGTPAKYPEAAAIGLTLFVFTGTAMWVYAKMLGRRDFTTITGKAFRPRLIDMRDLYCFSYCNFS